MPPAPDVIHLRAAIHTFLVMASATLQRAVGVSATVVSSAGVVPEPGARYVVVIGVEGDLSGVTWIIPQPLAQALVRKMIGSADPPFDQTALPFGGADRQGQARTIVRDAAIELANILMGCAGEMLAGYGMRVELTPPRLAATVAPGIGSRLSTAHGMVDVVFHPAGRAA